MTKVRVMIPYDIPDAYGTSITREVAEKLANDLRSDTMEVEVKTYTKLVPPYWAELGFESEDEYLDAYYDDETEGTSG